MDYVLDWMIGLFIADPVIASAVGTKIFSGPIFDEPQPDYPAIVITRNNPGKEERSVPLSSQGIMVSILSTNSYDECWKVMDALKPLISRVNGSNNGKYWVCYPYLTPWQDSDRTERQVYILRTVFNVEFIG